MNSLFIRGIKLRRAEVESFDRYPFDIPVIKGLTELQFEKPVTFIVGENGSGKSTVIEALAVAMGLSAEGGTRNMMYETINTTSKLHDYLTVLKSGLPPKWKYFLRAESFYTMANAFEGFRESWEMPIHSQSHGEAFNRLFDSFAGNGLYLMDEPESALSPKNQMRLLTRMHALAKSGSQFIIVTHSPILLSYYDGVILNADDNLRHIDYKDTEIFSIYSRFLSCPEKMQRYLFDD
ncbi:MAG: AAA family ATPase [Clostridiales bacterium]|nr:AAA family ATPase [Clostridiales bacterium]